MERGPPLSTPALTTALTAALTTALTAALTTALISCGALWLVGCGGSPLRTTASQHVTTRGAAPDAGAVARAYIESLLSPGSTAWRRQSSLPMAWQQRCTLLTDWSAVARRVQAQRPPVGTVRIAAVRRASQPDVHATDAMADAWRALFDVQTSCGSARLDELLHGLRGLRHRLFRVTLTTASGQHPLMLRVTKGSNGWRVTGMRSR